MQDNGKPQLEHLCNDITLTLVPIGYYQVPTHFMFFLMTRIHSVRRCYFTQNGSVFVSHIWTHSGVNLSSSSEEDLHPCKLSICCPIKPFCIIMSLCL